MKKLLLTLAIAIFSLTGFSQTAEVGLLGGLSYYLGDLNPGIHFLGSRPAWGAVGRVNLDNRWVARASFVRARVKGDDSKGNAYEQRGLKFETRLTDIALTAEFNFFDYFTGSRKNLMTPYIFGGIGMVIFDPKRDGVDLRSLGTEGQNVGFEGRKPYSRIAFAIPFGVGFKYSLNRRICFSGEWGLRKAFTDYIDDVSTTYYLDGASIDPNNAEQVLSDPTFQHKPMQERGNPATNDWYCFAGVNLTYKFRLYNKNKCPNNFGPVEDDK